MGPGAGRAKLRLSRGFTLDLAEQRHPTNSWPDYHFTAPEPGVKFRSHIFCPATSIVAHIVLSSK
jgi:hypothetical protein